MEPTKKILVRGPNWTGDVVMATPAFRALRKAHPNAHIALHLLPGLEPLVAGSPWFDEVIPHRSHQKGLPALLREARCLRKERFDLGICLPDSFASALLLRAAGVKRVVGYRSQGRGWLLHQAVAPTLIGGRRALISRERHCVELIEAAGCAADGMHLELHVTPDEERRAREILAIEGIDLARPLAALAPGASYGPSKLWPTSSFAGVGDALISAGVQVLVLGSPKERNLGARVTGAMEHTAADLTGRIDLGCLKAVLRKTQLLVCNDAGARHLAVAFRVPCVVLMGPTSLAKTDLNLERVVIQTADVGCRPCYHRVCPIDHRCMTRIEVKSVAEAALASLAKAAEPEGGAAQGDAIA